MSRDAALLVQRIAGLTLPSAAGGRVRLGTLLESPGLVLHLDRPGETVVRGWSQVAHRLAASGYRVALALAGRRAWRLREALLAAPLTGLIDEDLRLAAALGAVRRLPLLGPRVESATLIVSRLSGELRVEFAAGGGDGFSHTLWALEEARRLAAPREV